MTSLSLRGKMFACFFLFSFLIIAFLFYFIFQRFVSFLISPCVNLGFTLSEFSPWVSDAIRTSFSLQFLPVASLPLALLAPFLYCCFLARKLYEIYFSSLFFVTFIFSLIAIILYNCTLPKLEYYITHWLSHWLSRFFEFVLFLLAFLHPGCFVSYCSNLVLSLSVTNL